MTFDIDKFRQAQLAPRTSEVKALGLKDWFGEGVEPVFKIRGLTGEEFYAVREATQKRRDLQAIASRLFSGEGGAFADAIEEFYGGVPDELARRIEVLIGGCVDPKFDRTAALKLFKYYPSDAHLIAEAILRATGEGAVLGESKGSGATPACATTSI
jgi:hypothetical protein